MNIKVAKFGGSSVADAAQFKKVKNIVESDPSRRYVVVSAPGKRYGEDNKITDLLYLSKAHLEHNVPFDQVYQVICDRYISIKRDLNLSTNIEKYLDEIKDRLSKGATSDYIASRGEYINALLMAEYLGFDFIDTAGVIKFDNRGRFLQEETNEALAEELTKHERAVIPGFYGTFPDGKIKTFSRGGSDITGSIVARAANATVYENWTDVSGFLMADPRIVPNAKPIKHITYKELRELSYMGASVLHEDAVFPVRAADIPINIRNTNEPDNPGTTIVGYAPTSRDSIITGIAGKRGCSIIGLYKNMMNSDTRFIQHMLAILADYDVIPEHIPSGIDTISVVVPTKQLVGKLDDILEEFEKKLEPDNIEVLDDVALIATVGYGMNKKLGVAARLFRALTEARVNVRTINQGSSEINIIVGVKDKDFEHAISAIYKEFVDQNE